MSEQGAALQTYNQELVKCIETMKKKRADLMKLIQSDLKMKERLEKEMAALNTELSVVCDSLNERLKKKSFYDETIENSEAAYMKILESSQALLSVVRQDVFSLDQPTNANANSETST